MTKRSNFKIDKWQKELQDIHGKVFFLWHNNKEFSKYKDSFNNKALSFELFRFMRRNYVTFMSMGVRRLVDRNSQSISLMRIIEDIHYNSKSFKKSWFLKRYPDAINEKLFDDFFSDNNSLKKGVVLSDIKKLESRTKKIKDYADKWEAHWDEKRHKIKSPTYNDLDLAVNSIVKIYKRYYYLLKQAGLEFSEF